MHSVNDNQPIKHCSNFAITLLFIGSSDGSTIVVLAVVLPVLGVLVIAAFIVLAVLLWTLVRAKMKMKTKSIAKPNTDDIKMDLL